MSNFINGPGWRVRAELLTIDPANGRKPGLPRLHAADVACQAARAAFERGPYAVDERIASARASATCC